MQVQAFHDMPSELVFDQELERALLSAGRFHVGSTADGRKLVSQRPAPSDDSRASVQGLISQLQRHDIDSTPIQAHATPTWLSPTPATPSAMHPHVPRQAQHGRSGLGGSHHMAPPYGPRPGALQSNAFHTGQLGISHGMQSPPQARPGHFRMEALPGAQSLPTQPPGPWHNNADPRGMHGGPNLESAVLAFLQSRNAYDGPKSQAVEAIRTQLLQTPDVAGHPALGSLAAFQGFLMCIPAIQVRTPALLHTASDLRQSHALASGQCVCKWRVHSLTCRASSLTSSRVAARSVLTTHFVS